MLEFFCVFLLESRIQHSRLRKLHNFCAEYVKGRMASILVDKLHNVTLFVNPKAGSSTWKLTLLNSSGTWTWRNADNGPVHNPSIYKYAKGIYTKSATQMSVNDVLTALNTHCTIVNVRHPFDRLESAFRDKVMKINYINLRKQILKERGVARFQSHEIQFYEFIRHVLRNPNDKHWKPMVKNSHVCNIPYG